MQKPMRLRALGTALALPLLVATAPAWADPVVSVTVNGAPIALNPAPVTRAGRVFVPLRGIFERLGASVVYAGGTINATGRGGRTIALHIGSTTATVNGADQPLDVAPFVIGASTFVPLRFVGQALGAVVNYDGTNSIVAITTGPGGPPPQQVNAPPPGDGDSVGLRDVEPPRGGSVDSVRPTISANFSRRVDPNSVHVMLDGRDVTGVATLSDSGIIFAPGSPLQSIRHTVAIEGKDQAGAPFQRDWSFTTGTASAENFVRLRDGLADGGTVSGSNFAVSGKTLPNARVHVIAGASRGFGNAFSFPTGNYTGDTIADGNGNFRVDVSLQTVPGGAVAVDITSTDPASKASAEQKLHLTSQ